MKKTLKPVGEQPTKICAKCTKKKVLSAFGVDVSRPDGHNDKCKVCVNARDRERRIENFYGEYPKHRWEGGNICLRCNVRRKMKANYLKVGKYIVKYLVDGKWVDYNPKCITIKESLHK